MRYHEIISERPAGMAAIDPNDIEIKKHRSPDPSAVNYEVKQKSTGKSLGGGMIQRVDDKFITCHGYLRPEARRLGLAHKFIQLATEIGKKEGRTFVAPGTIPGSGSLSDDGMKFIRGMNFFRGKNSKTE